MRNQAIFRYGYADRYSAARVLKQYRTAVSLRMIHLYHSGTCRFMGSIQYDDLLARGKFHVVKVDHFASLASGTYEQLVDIWRGLLSTRLATTGGGG